MAVPGSDPSPKEVKIQEKPPIGGSSSIENGLQAQAVKHLSGSGLSTAEVQGRFAPEDNLSKNGFPKFFDGPSSAHKGKDGTKRDDLLAMAGDTNGSKIELEKDKSEKSTERTEPFEFLGKGKDKQGREYLSFKAPASMDVKDVKYYPEEGHFEMEPKGGIPKPARPQAYDSEQALPITKAVMNPETGRMDFHLANKGWVKKGYGKTLNFGVEEPDGSLKFGGTIVNNDGKSFEVKDITGISGHHYAVGYKPIESFTMSATADGHQTVPVVRNEGPRSAEPMTKSEFENLTGNARNYMNTLSQLRSHISEQNFLASKK